MIFQLVFIVSLLLLRTEARTYYSHRCYNDTNQRIDCPSSRTRTIIVVVVVALICAILLAYCFYRCRKSRGCSTSTSRNFRNSLPAPTLPHAPYSYSKPTGFHVDLESGSSSNSTLVSDFKTPSEKHAVDGTTSKWSSWSPFGLNSKTNLTTPEPARLPPPYSNH
ncbi:hypothetical protein PM082_001402 [Marasmius tenuissimus]|nr:hypothetical protein PM082_001402 [Marasmius tenuissimus]